MQKYIFYLLLIFLPTQLGLHFWPEWAFINGIRVDYFSPTLYLTDIFILGIFLLWLAEVILQRKYQVSSIKYYGKFLLGYCFIGLLIYLNVVHSLSPFVSLYKWLKFLELGFLAYWTAKHWNTSKREAIAWCLLVPVFYESVLAVWQFVNQGSIGGLWYLLGERTFTSSTPGIANAFFNGQLILRPYGTFPHPNVLGGFLAVVLPLILIQSLHNSRKINARRTLGTLGILGVLGMGYITLFLSMSRTAILVGLGTTFLIIWRARPMRLISLISLIGLMGLIIVFLFPRFTSLKTETESLQVRGQLNNVALEQFAKSPLFGTGLGTSPLYYVSSIKHYGISNYALAFQPPHNIYLLLLSETGIIGFLGFCFLTYKIVRRAPPLILNTLYSILILGLFDHYFLTLQQGQLLLALISGIIAACLWPKK